MLMTAATPIVLITADEEYLADEAVRGMYKLLKQHDAELERRDINPASDDALLDFQAAVSPGLFGDAALVTVDPVGACDESLQQAILALIADPTNETKVLLIHRGGVKGQGFIKQLRASKITEREFPKLKNPEITKFLESEFKRHKRKIDPSAVSVLRDALGDDLRTIAAAVSQLSADIAADPIGVDQIADYFEGMAAVAPYQIADAVFNGKVTQALTSLRWGLDRDPNLGPALVANMANTVRSLVVVYHASPSDSQAEIARQAGVPPFRVPALKQQVRLWSPRMLANAALLLTQTDAALKAGVINELGVPQVLDPAQRTALLERTVLTIAQMLRRD